MTVYTRSWLSPATVAQATDSWGRSAILDAGKSAQGALANQDLRRPVVAGPGEVHSVDLRCAAHTVPKKRDARAREAIIVALGHRRQACAAGIGRGSPGLVVRKLGGQGPEFAALEAGPSAAQHRIVRHGARLLSHIFETRPVCVVTQPGPPVGHRSRGARLGQPQPSQALLAVVATNPQRTPRRADTGPSASSSSSVASSTTYEVAFVAPSSTPCGLTPSRPSCPSVLCVFVRNRCAQAYRAGSCSYGRLLLGALGALSPASVAQSSRLHSFVH